ncbi:DUF3352 domain-containing protein [Flagellimonas taeanensis]|uniref:DUF3352 domain-containing protein n=1 Tax=Flavobacteriaceae TaxID=49546 RepID=UPI000E69BB92|nr:MULTISPECIES: DUF3352 domain-containing protein [Allomuricauda]MDC6383897.1 DUF3352 domain-containing protein [Muricauda sp. SK9]RIV48515.1 DUF3352 domain-containing protein [Allomuricauda taeanensis]
MTKKRILYGFLALFALYLCYLAYIFLLSPKTNLQSIYLIPKDAVFIVESEQPVESWKKVSESDAWHHLRKNDYFSELTESIQKVDTVFNNNHKLFEFFDGRSLFISVHMISPKDYGIFYVLDLKRIAKLQLLKTYLNTLLNDDYVMSKRMYHNHEILEVHDRESKETMYLAFIKNQLVASYTHTLVEASIDQYQEPVLGRNLNFIEVNQKVGHEDLFRMYVQYHYFDDYVKRFTDTPSDWVRRVSENFLFSGFYFDLDKNSTLTANGFTNISGTNEYYLEALQKSGTAERTIPTIVPKRTALYISYGFDSFSEFYKNFEKVQQNDPQQFESYQNGIEKVEKFLKIDVKENFVNWIDDEIAVLQIQSRISKGKNDMALVLKANDAEKARTNLDFVLEQIRRKTPVKFKTVEYKKYEINFLSIKGFFKMLLGGRFDEFDKPYFTQIDEFVIFSDNPNTLKSIIDDALEGETLATSKEFRDFDDKFESESTVFIYSNVPLFFDNMYALADAPTQQKMLKNKDFIICFPQFGLQLTPEDDLFESRLVINYQDVQEVKRNTPLEVKVPSSKPQSADPVEITDAVFDLRPIYPTDLNADTFSVKYANGTTKFEVELKDGLKHGRYTEYYLDGTEKMTGRFRKDEQVGTWRYYNEEGEQVHKKRF